MNYVPAILFRKSLESEGEFDIAKKYLPAIEYRSLVPSGSLVIPRYSCLPFYQELEAELAAFGSRIVNSYTQHSWIADAMSWAGPGGLLEGRTPRTWDNWVDLPTDKAFVLKGRTNSRKQQWDSHMFASNRKWVPVVASRLLDDTFISQQGLLVREYVPLRRLGGGLNKLPISNEWRTFWYADHGNYMLLAKGFYWGSHPELREAASFPFAGVEFASECASLIAEANAAHFFVLDVAETADGSWILVEVNDGSMSGLGLVDPHMLYANLSVALSRKGGP